MGNVGLVYEDKLKFFYLKEWIIKKLIFRFLMKAEDCFDGGVFLFRQEAIIPS
jgi:hypothetical protein